jgi:hypothetical protein
MCHSHQFSFGKSHPTIIRIMDCHVKIRSTVDPGRCGFLDLGPWVSARPARQRVICISDWSASLPFGPWLDTFFSSIFHRLTTVLCRSSHTGWRCRYALLLDRANRIRGAEKGEKDGSGLGDGGGGKRFPCPFTCLLVIFFLLPSAATCLGFI